MHFYPLVHFLLACTCGCSNNIENHYRAVTVIRYFEMRNQLLETRKYQMIVYIFWVNSVTGLTEEITIKASNYKEALELVDKYINRGKK
jgi:hypothetical protein